jgi:hypothetical protein
VPDLDFSHLAATTPQAFERLNRAWGRLIACFPQLPPAETGFALEMARAVRALGQALDCAGAGETPWERQVLWSNPAVAQLLRQGGRGVAVEVAEGGRVTRRRNPRLKTQEIAKYIESSSIASARFDPDAWRELGRAVRRYASAVLAAVKPEGYVAAEPRPNEPTLTYCLLEAGGEYRLRWEGEVMVAPRLWFLLQCLLEHGEQTPLRRAVAADNKNPPLRRKTLVNYLSELNQRLADIMFPWHYKLVASHIWRK